MGSDCLFSVGLCAKAKDGRRKMMRSKITGMAGLAAAFIAGMVVATALSWGMTAGEAKTPGAAPQQQVTVQQVISPTVTDEEIALRRKDLRAMRMQVSGQNMSLSDEE